MAALDFSVIVTTYERPWHLQRCLRSLEAQLGVAGRYEIIVVDDGSQDDTTAVVNRFAQRSSVPVTFLTHPHEGFQPGKGRNSGIRAATAPYLLFTDGDCIFPRDHLYQHLAARRPRVARAGDCFRLDRSDSERIDEAAAARGDVGQVAARAARSLKRVYRKTVVHQWMRSQKRPKMISWNMAAWRDDLLRINGFDERFRGWGCEDDDVGCRLRASGVRIATALGYTHAYHLWHPQHVTTPHKWSEGINVPYFTRPVRLTRCLDGIERREPRNLAVHVTADHLHASLASELKGRFANSTKPELELLLWPSAPKFKSRAEHRILVISHDGPAVPARLSRQAHATIDLGEQKDAHALLRALDRLLSGESSPAVASKVESQDA